MPLQGYAKNARPQHSLKEQSDVPIYCPALGHWPSMVGVGVGELDNAFSLSLTLLTDVKFQIYKSTLWLHYLQFYCQPQRVENKC